MDAAPADRAPSPGLIARARGRLAAARGWRRWLIATGLGALAGSSLPPLFVLPGLLIALPAQLLLLDGSRSARGAAGCGFWFGFGMHVVGLYWITDAILLEAARFWWLVPLAVPGLAAVLAAFVAAPCALAWRAPAGWPRAAALAGGWVLGDVARQFVLTGFPWNPLGSVWALPGRLGDVMLQPASLVGVHGLTLATVLLACTPALGRRAMLAGGGALLLWAGFGLWRTAAPVPEAADDLAVVLVQGDIAQGHKWDRAVATANFLHYLALTRDGSARAGARFPGLRKVLIWPETASPFLLDEDANARAAMAEAAGPGALVLAGSVRFGADGRPRNSLMAIGSEQPPLGIYDKWHLVPFGEYQPSWARIGIQLVPGEGFAAGPGARTLHLPGWPAVGPLICYEAIFPGAVVDEADRPAWMANITNDAWFGNSSGPRQHLAAARIRAVEEGLPLARAANTGISAAFDRLGHEQGRLRLETTGVLAVRVRPDAGPPTPAARLGLIAPLMLAALSLGVGLRARAICRGFGRSR